ncbi:MAG: cytidine deaminase [Bacteroidales bacterium]|nr:cytidine deaminase [Bacteroidales bacterium]
MKEKKIETTYLEYEGAEQMSAADRELVEMAVKATRKAYTPYSKFNVGAAIRLEGDIIVVGNNQENLAYPSGLCAERTAMFYAASTYPDKAMKTIAIAATQGGELTPDPVTPCGACRQVMAEYQTRSGQPMEIILVGRSAIWKFSRVDDLLPFIFDNLKI